ncbi:MAG: hypothetical protein IJ617_09565 [Oscillospiraceae bacterium]|nr:hypothetical protein [Oscillospiraceae bacterium]
MGQEENAIEMLDRILLVLHEMYKLAERSAQDDCSMAERALLQRDLEDFEKMIDRIADHYQG